MNVSESDSCGIFKSWTMSSCLLVIDTWEKKKGSRLFFCSSINYVLGITLSFDACASDKKTYSILAF